MEGSVRFKPFTCIYLLNGLSSVQKRAAWRLSQSTTALGNTSPLCIHPLGRSHIGASSQIAQSRLLRTKGYGLTRKPMMKSGTLAHTSLAFRYPPCRFSPLGRSFKPI